MLLTQLLAGELARDRAHLAQRRESADLRCHALDRVDELFGALVAAFGVAVERSAEHRIEGLPNVVFEVVPSELKDKDGKVFQVVG